MSATAFPDKPATEKIVNVVIIYDELASATKANAVLERVFHQASQIGMWNVKPWRLDLLNVPAIAAEALKDTADAHLIVFALRPTQSPSEWLLDWLEQWASKRQVGEAALAVFVGGNGEAPSTTTAVRQLPQFARRHGLNFIFDASIAAQDKPEVLNHNVQEGELSGTPALQVTDEPVHEHWGINE